jgi:hypothetical protein
MSLFLNFFSLFFTPFLSMTSEFLVYRKPLFLFLTKTLWLLGVLLLLSTDVMAQINGMGGGGARRYNRNSNINNDSGPLPQEEKPLSLQTAQNQAEYHLTHLLDELKLSPELESLWLVYTQKVIALVNDINRQHEQSTQMVLMSPTKQIDRLTRLTENRLTALEEIQNATNAIYNRLNPEQKSKMDVKFTTLLPLLLNPVSSVAGRVEKQKTP